MKKINRPILALIIANIIWGAASPIFKYSLENISPFTLAFLRFLIASCLLYPFIHKKLKMSDLKNKWLWLFSLCATTFNISFYFLALQRTVSINAPIIASAGPIFILIGSIIWLREKPKIHVILGLILSLIGIIFIILEPIINHGVATEIIGNLLLIAATISAAIQVLVGRKILTHENAIPFTFWVFFIGTITFLPLMLIEYIKDPGILAVIDSRGLTGIIFGGLFSSLAAYILYHWAIARMQAYKVSVFAYLDPVVAILIAIPLLGEKITSPFLIGSVLVFSGIYIAENRLPWHPLRKIFESGKIEMS